MGLSGALAAVGTVITAVGQIQQGKAQAQAFRYQQQVARNNQIIAQRSADDARRRGELEANIQRQKSAILQGHQRAALAGAGVLVDQDTALDVVSETAGIGELDALTIRSNAEREALGFEQRGMNFSAEADLRGAASDQARTGSFFQAAGTILSGSSRVAQRWQAFKNQGVDT